MAKTKVKTAYFCQNCGTQYPNGRVSVPPVKSGTQSLKRWCKKKRLSSGQKKVLTPK